MERANLRCAGLDVRMGTVIACARIVEDGETTDQIKSFGTSPPELDDLAGWLRVRGCSHAMMESAGSEWKLVWNALKDSLAVVLTSALPAGTPGPASAWSNASRLADLLVSELSVRSARRPA